LRAAISSRDARAQKLARVFLRDLVTFCDARFPADDHAPWVKHERGGERADLASQVSSRSWLEVSS